MVVALLERREFFPILQGVNVTFYLLCICLPGLQGFPGGSVVKKSACQAGDMGLITGQGRSPEEGNDNQLQYSCLENLMDKGAWQATVPGVKKSGHN